MKPRPLAVRPEELPAIRRAFCRELRPELVGKRVEVSKSWRGFDCSLGEQGAVLLMGSSASPAPKGGYPTRPAPSGGLLNTPASGRGWLLRYSPGLRLRSPGRAWRRNLPRNCTSACPIL